MTVKEIVYGYLLVHGYDGLYSEPDTDCACTIPTLMHCDGVDTAGCMPGYRVPCPDDCGEHEFHIVKIKP